MSYVLIADIGGTHARFARADAHGVADERVLRVADYEGPAAAAKAYMAGLEAGLPHPGAATFAVAGPVTGSDIVDLTNHPWRFSIEATRAALGLESLDIINDFHAMALGVLAVDPASVRPLGKAVPLHHGNIGVIGPGTGLGVASLIWDSRGGYYVPVPSEGPHQTLPVRTEREWSLVRWMLQHKYAHVSAERVCSGKGLVNLYEAVCGVSHAIAEPLEPEMITARALNGTCAACAEAVDLMLGFLGRVAGNLALVANARGGVYLCGGILPRLGFEFIERSRLRREFSGKGRMSAYVDTMPTFFIDDRFLPLRGLRIHALGE